MTEIYLKKDLMQNNSILALPGKEKENLMFLSSYIRLLLTVKKIVGGGGKTQLSMRMLTEITHFSFWNTVESAHSDILEGV